MQELSTLTMPQIIICLILVAALIAAIVAFIKTPASERFSIKDPVGEPGIEYAPMYSKHERKRILIKSFVILIPAVIFMEYWFFPKLAKYSSEANCHLYGSISGVHLVFYGVFVGIPLIAFLLLLPSALKAIKVFKVGQFPLPGEKVMQLTKYRYGIPAKLQASVVVIAAFSFIVVAILGVGAASKTIEKTEPCAANKSLKDAP